MSQDFFRDSSNGVFGGLIAGTARHLGLSKPILFFLRVAALVLFLSSPISLLLYFILSIMTPSKEYPSDYDHMYFEEE